MAGAILVALSARAVAAPAPDGVDPVEEVDAVQQFLARLGLADLQALDLENVLRRDLPGERRVEIARRLADLYVGLLMSESQDEARSKEVYARVETLVKEVPEANTPSLGVLMLQAEYNRAEADACRWLREPGDTASRDAARTALAGIIPRLREHQQEIDRLVDEGWQQVRDMQDDRARAAKEEETSRLESVATRAAFLSGWANYYFALVGEQPGDASGEPPGGLAASSELATARKCFRRVLAIDEDDSLEELAADWFNLEAAWQCRALVGLGMAEAAGGNLAGCRSCFEVLKDPAVPPSIRDEALYWHVQGLVNARKLEEARSVLEEQMAEWSLEATPGKVGACGALVAAAFAGKSKPTEEARAAGMLGIDGLVRLKQYNTLRKLMSQYSVALDQGGLLANGLKGRDLFDKAEASKEADDYRAARDALTAALAAREANREVVFAGQCRYTLGWCHYRLGDYRSAAEQFEEAAKGLKAADPSTAVKAVWSAVESYYQAASENDRYLASADRVLQTIQHDFPNDPLTQKVDYYRAKIRERGSSPEELIERLRQVKPASPNYRTARYEICLLEHQRWLKARGASGEGEVAADVYRAVDAYLLATQSGGEPAETLRCLLLAAEAALSARPVDVERARSYLGKAAPLAAGVPASDALAAEYRYRSFQLAGETGDDRARREHADWLVRHAAGSGYELPALIQLAKEADASAARENACQIYTRLVQLLGDSPNVISSQKNAEVASSRLASYLTQLGRHAEAAERLEKLLAAYPNDGGYLRRAGLAHFEAGDYAQSLPHWRKLLAGLPPDSESWYEAKYYQLACLAEVDQAQACQVFEQFELLHPEFGPEPWREKLKGFRGRLSRE